MKKIYLQPEMELTECVMLRSAVCSNTAIQDNNQPDQEPGYNFGTAPGRKVF